MVPQMEDKHKYKENRSYCFQWGKNTPNINIKTKNNTIKHVTAKRMLGVILDEKLTFKYHIKHICLQARKSYSQLAAFPNLLLSTLKTLYKSFIRSKLEYCCSVWGPKLYLHSNLQNIKSVQRGALSLILRPFKSTTTIAHESELNIPPIDIRLKQLQAMECIKILRKRDNPLKDTIMRIRETPTAYLLPLEHLAKVGKELLVKISKTRIANISDVKIEPEPMITSATTHNISIENICTKDKRKDNNFINNQIQKFPNDTIIIFTDGSCQNNPGPTGAGSLVFKDGINNPPIKFGKAVSKLSTNYHGELEAILLSLKYIRTINLIGIKKVHIFTDSMSSIQAIISTKQQE